MFPVSLRLRPAATVYGRDTGVYRGSFRRARSSITVLSPSFPCHTISRTASAPFPRRHVSSITAISVTQRSARQQFAPK